MSISNLYKRQIIEHYKNPLNTKILKTYTHKAKVANLSCGDETEVRLIIKNQRVKQVSHQTIGCSIAVASASMFSNFIINKELKDLKKYTIQDIEKLLHVRLSPARKKCANLILEAIKQAISSPSKPTQQLEKL